jgi:hypothetical protein
MKQMPEPDRLRLPKGYGSFEPFTIESAPGWDEFEPRLEFARNYWVSVCDLAGPHSVPVWGIWSDLSFIFSSDPASRKGRAIAAGSPCQMHLESGDDVVIVSGRIEMLPADMLLKFLDAYEEKYGVLIDPADPSSAIYRLIPERAMTWIERDFQQTAARWEF